MRTRRNVKLILGWVLPSFPKIEWVTSWLVYGPKTSILPCGTIVYVVSCGAALLFNSKIRASPRLTLMMTPSLSKWRILSVLIVESRRILEEERTGTCTLHICILRICKHPTSCCYLLDLRCYSICRITSTLGVEKKTTHFLHFLVIFF